MGANEVVEADWSDDAGRITFKQEVCQLHISGTIDLSKETIG